MSQVNCELFWAGGHLGQFGDTLFCILLGLVYAQANKCDLSCGNGTCAFDKFNQSYCQCKPDFAGKQCELTLCDSPFQLQCKNNGRCFMNDKRDKFQCICDENHQFSGALCEKSVCADYCLNDNRCEVIFDVLVDGRKIARPSCTCLDSRYTGDRCEFDRCLNARSSCPRNCSLTTSSCQCVCGPTCDTNYCNGNGVCVEKNDQVGCK